MTTFERDLDELAIQAAIEEYFDRCGSFPSEMREALVGQPRALAAMERLGWAHVRYTREGTRGYRLTFLGIDGGLRTVEDHPSYRAKSRALRDEPPEPGDLPDPVIPHPPGPELPDFRLIFEQLPERLLVLTARLRIMAASDAYLRAAGVDREQIVGRHFSEIFSENPADAPAPNLCHLQGSVERVLQLRSADATVVQRWNLPRPNLAGRALEQRYWKCANAPVLGPEGEVVYIVHRVEDVTEVVKITRRDGKHHRRRAAPPSHLRT